MLLRVSILEFQGFQAGFRGTILNFARTRWSPPRLHQLIKQAREVRGLPVGGIDVDVKRAEAGAVHHAQP